MAVNIHITIIELNALHTKRQNLFQELDAVIHLLMEAKHWGLRKSRNATSLDRKSGSAGMPRPISYAVFCLKKKTLTVGLYVNALVHLITLQPSICPFMTNNPLIIYLYTLSLHDALPICQHTYHHYRTQRPAYEKTESLPRA